MSLIKARSRSVAEYKVNCPPLKLGSVAEYKVQARPGINGKSSLLLPTLIGSYLCIRNSWCDLNASPVPCVCKVRSI